MDFGDLTLSIFNLHVETGNVRKKVRKKNVAIKDAKKLINIRATTSCNLLVQSFLYYNKLHLFLQHTVYTFDEFMWQNVTKKQNYFNMQ